MNHNFKCHIFNANLHLYREFVSWTLLPISIVREEVKVSLHTPFGNVHDQVYYYALEYKYNALNFYFPQNVFYGINSTLLRMSHKKCDLQVVNFCGSVECPPKNILS